MELEANNRTQKEQHQQLAALDFASVGRIRWPDGVWQQQQQEKRLQLSRSLSLLALVAAAAQSERTNERMNEWFTAPAAVVARADLQLARLQIAPKTTFARRPNVECCSLSLSLSHLCRLARLLCVCVS